MIQILWGVYKIIRWHKKTFKISYEQQRDHFESEMLEWQSAFLSYMTEKSDKNLDDLNMERADVIISGINLLRFPEARALVHKKMNINKKRKWKNDRHVED